jgi:hypothetical protein
MLYVAVIEKHERIVPNIGEFIPDEVGSVADVLAFEFCDEIKAVEKVFESTETVDCVS